MAGQQEASQPARGAPGRVQPPWELQDWCHRWGVWCSSLPLIPQLRTSFLVFPEQLLERGPCEVLGTQTQGQEGRRKPSGRLGT